MERFLITRTGDAFPVCEITVSRLATGLLTLTIFMVVPAIAFDLAAAYVELPLALGFAILGYQFWNNSDSTATAAMSRGERDGCRFCRIARITLFVISAIVDWTWLKRRLAEDDQIKELEREIRVKGCLSVPRTQARNGC